MYAARTRVSVDGNPRAVYLSCGAALFSLRMAIVAMQREPEVRLLPSPGIPIC